MPPKSFDIAALTAAYRSGDTTPGEVVRAALKRIGADPHRAWIALRPADALAARAAVLEHAGPAGRPLWGIPFAVKDNIDVADLPTTAGCPAFAFTPKRSATVVERLEAAGAIAIGKTNLDQFATGLNGTRSPYGACRNPFDPAFVSGGSSSGSAVAVALGQVAFALGTDTAGSGRVPAAFNNLIGLKPTRGLLSTRGVVPACRTLDVVSVFALDAADAARVFAVAAGTDPEDPLSRPAEPHGFDVGAGLPFRYGVPRDADLAFDGDAAAERLFREAVSKLEALGGRAVTVDLSPALAAARLLYEDAFVAERTAAVGAFVSAHPDAVHPVVRGIIEGGRRYDAAALFTAQLRLGELRGAAMRAFADIDVLVTPTTPSIPTIAAMEADPVALNARLGVYTNFVNLLDMSAVAVPAGFRPDGLPLGVTLVARAHQDWPLLRLAQRLESRTATPLGATGMPRPAADVPAGGVSGRIRVAVCGAHMEGLPLNGQLTARDGRLVARTRSAPLYRLYALPGGPPARPGMVRVADGGASIELEVWDVDGAAFGSFVEGIPAPLGIGRVVLADGTSVAGFVCEGVAADGAEDVTRHGGWRAYLASRA